jgi:hypothetical protein
LDKGILDFYIIEFSVQASLPDSVSLTIEQAPMEWALPVRKEQHMRPSFRISVVVKSRLAGVLPLRVTPHILTEEELLNSAIDELIFEFDIDHE